MHILALDTTSRGGSVAVARDGSLLHQHVGDPGLTHGERLPGDLMRTLQQAGIRVDDLDLLAVAAGPGSFTGLRVGVAAVQGLAMARGLAVVPVPTLEALARAHSVASAFENAKSVASALDNTHSVASALDNTHSVASAFDNTHSVASAFDNTHSVASAFRRKGTLVAAWMDGQRGEVFGALYEVLSGEDGNREIQPPMAGSPAAVLDAWALTPDDSPIVFIGDGAVRYREVLEARVGTRARIVAPPPLAPTIARIAFEEPGRAVEPHAIVPVYVRRPDAELARERRDQGLGIGDPASGTRGRTVVERVTSAQDLDEVAALEAACFTNPWTRAMLERELRESEVARVYVLRDESGGVAAFCTCWVIVDELHINTIAVHPAKRRAGLATTLMRHVMEDAAASGATRATLEVRASNQPARRLYERLGFVESAIRPRYYIQPDEDAIVLWRGALVSPS